MNDFMRRILVLPEQASTVAPGIDALHYFVIIVTMIGSAAVFTTALVFVVKYRRVPGTRATPRVEAGIKLEVGLLVGLLVLFLVWWLIGYRQYIHLRYPPDDAMEVYVTGKQWMWKFTYPEGIHQAPNLTVPVDQPVKLIMTSRDVIHSFYVPAFRVKMDVIPGRYTTLWFEATRPGVYPIYCAEFCGLEHARMIGEVVVLDSRDWERWIEHVTPDVGPPIASTAAIPGNLAARGREVAIAAGCLACHSIDGSPHIGPTFVGLYGSISPATDGTEVLVDEGHITRSMMDPRARIREGFPPVMPSYQGILAPAETAAILEYIKSLRFGDAAGRGEDR
jgi:cytochrome c oxidase subunit II